MQRSENIATLTTALIEAQKNFKPLVKRTVNPYYNKPYADLPEVIECTQPYLLAQGLTIVQFPYFEDNKPGIETILLHTSGEFISRESTIPGEQKNPQTFGIGQTYLRRYGWQAVCGIAADTDDDANSVSGKDNPPPKKAQPKVNQTPANSNTDSRPARTETTAEASSSVKTEDTTLDRVPDKQEMKEQQSKVREWVKKPGVDRDQLIAYIKRQSQQEDSSLITLGQWATIWRTLEINETAGTLAIILGGKNE